jgi:cobalt-zinc-cadmium efflux system outer membrane protein
MNRWTMGLLAGALWGCSGPAPAPLDPENSESEFRARTLSDPGLRDFIEANLGSKLDPFPPVSWDLTKLTLAAFYYHPELDLARARLGIAQAGVTTARMWPNPTVSLDLERVWNQSAPPTPWVYGLTLSYPVDTLWKRGYRIKEARRTTEQAGLDLGLAAWRVRSRLRTTLVDHLLALRELALRRTEEDVRREVVVALRQRLAAGAVFRLDVGRAEAELATTQIALLADESQVAETRAALAGALGVPGSALDGASLSWPELETPPRSEALPLSTLQKAGLVHRLELRRTLSEYEAAEAVLKLEIAKRYPEFNPGLGLLNDQGDHKVTLTPSFTLPIFNQNEGPIAEALARRKEVAARFAAIQAEVIAETETTLARYRGTLQEFSKTEEILSLLETQEKTTRRAVELGAEDRVALTGVRLGLVVGGSSRLTALRKVQSSLGALEDAVQGPLDQVGILPPAPFGNPRDRAKKEENP